MKKIKYWIACGIVCLIFVGTTRAQKGTGKKTTSPAPTETVDFKQYHQQITQMVSYVQYCLNYIGSDSTWVSDKEEIIKYTIFKVVKDSSVMVEDDLDAQRVLPIHKPIQAYLKDVDFFYKHVQFQLRVLDITHFTRSNGATYFKVKLERVLQGTDLKKNVVKNTATRFMEFNLNELDQSLKLVSYYTNILNEDEELLRWWTAMPLDWKERIGAEVNILPPNAEYPNGISLADVLVLFPDAKIGDAYKVGSYPLVISQQALLPVLSNWRHRSRLDLSFVSTLTDISPLEKMDQLEHLNLSGTLVTDLTPLRNLTQLQTLQISNTTVQSLAPLQYLSSLKVLEAYGTSLSSLDFLAYFSQLEELNVGRTFIKNFPENQVFPALKQLNVSENRIKNLEGIEQFPNLQFLNASATDITSLQPVAALSQLEQLLIEQTQIASLQPIDALTHMQFVFSDGSQISATEAQRFERAHKGCIVVYETAVLQNWWNALPQAWNVLFTHQFQLSVPITKEELHILAGMESLTIPSNSGVSNIQPLHVLSQLTHLTILDTNLTDLNHPDVLRKLQELWVVGNNLTHLEGLKGSTNLKKLHAQGAKLQSLQVFADMQQPLVLYIDHTPSAYSEGRSFQLSHPEDLVIYRTDSLKAWLVNMPQELAQKWGLSSDMSAQALHTFSLSNAVSTHGIKSLVWKQIFAPFLFLTTIEASNSGITTLSDIPMPQQLKLLDLSNNPIQDFSILAQFKALETLSVQNTRFIDTKILESLPQLKHVNLSGCAIKKLPKWSSESPLTTIDISNTPIKSLKPFESLQQLKVLKCFNTPIPQKAIDAFKQKFPQVEVLFY